MRLLRESYTVRRLVAASRVNVITSPSELSFFVLQATCMGWCMFLSVMAVNTLRGLPSVQSAIAKVTKTSGHELGLKLEELSLCWKNQAASNATEQNYP